MLRKFRTIEEHNAFSAKWNTEDDAERLAERLTALFERSRQLAPGLPRGVFRFRNQEEANTWREQWLQERITRMQEEQGRGRSRQSTPTD